MSALPFVNCGIFYAILAVKIARHAFCTCICQKNVVPLHRISCAAHGKRFEIMQSNSKTVINEI